MIVDQNGTHWVRVPVGAIFRNCVVNLSPFWSVKARNRNRISASAMNGLAEYELLTKDSAMFTCHKDERVEPLGPLQSLRRGRI